MVYPSSEDEKKLAQAPHNLFIICVFLFDLLLTPAAIVIDVGMYGLLLPLSCSLAASAYIYRQGRVVTVPYIRAHWQLAFKRSLWLMAGYAVTATLILLAWLLSLTTQASMQHILWTAPTRIAILPTLVAVMVTLVMEASAMSAALKGESI